MKITKIFLFLLGLTIYINNVNAQSGLSLEASQLYASFKFSDSQGNTLNSEYKGIFTNSYGLGYRHVLNNGIMLRAGLGMRNAGATLVYDDMNYNWNLQYADLRLGGGYFYKRDRISPYLNICGYYAYLLRGFQTINNEEFDIKYSELLNETDYGIYITPGVQFTFSEKVSSFVEFNYIMGLQNLEMDEGQKASNFALGVSLGFSISLCK